VLLTAKPSPAAAAPAFRWVAVFCALAVWMLGLLAVSPQLHAALHGEADQPDHTCAVTLFSHGVETASVGPGLIVAPALFPFGECAPPPALLVVASPDRLPPGRGPPLR
jgi:hypothetical protein